MATLSASTSSSPILDERRPPESSPPPTPTVHRKGSKKKRPLCKLISFSEQQMKLAFSILDEDQDGLVNASELLAALKKLGLEDCVDERVAVSLLKDATKTSGTSSNKSSSSKSSPLCTLAEASSSSPPAASTAAALEDELMSESQFLDWLPKLASYASPSNLVPSSPVTPPSPVSPSATCSNLLATADADLKAAFSVFDKDKDGYISRDELRSAMTLMKEKVSDHELDQVMSEADLDRDGRISFDEFARLMLR